MCCKVEALTLFGMWLENTLQVLIPSWHEKQEGMSMRQWVRVWSQ